MEQTMRPQESENLGQMVVAYKNQIKEIESILPFTTGKQRVELESLLRSMYEFIQLSDNHDADEKNPNRYKESKSAAPSASVSPSVSSIGSDELKKIAEQWEGKNCRAPFQQLSGSVSYHNAVVVHIEPNLDPEGDILVQVAFSNPTTAKMRPCSFYMNGTCRFSDMKCRYSHGHIVKLSSLKEYVEPDFRLIRVETRVLAKSPKDELWYPGVVSNELENHIFTIALDDSLTSLELPLQFLLPVEKDVDEPDADTDDNTAVVGTEHQLGTLEQVGWSYATALSNLPLGEWEKHTKGIGSKLMANMGYRIGQGLGKGGQGRLNPVDAVVLPAGRSLDHCMELKEQAMDQDLLKVEKRLERAKAKEERRLQQMSERAPEKPSSSIFDFMNSTLAAVNPKPSTSAEPTKSKNIKSLSTERLNLQGFQLAETIRKTEKDLAHLRTSLQRQQNRGDTQLVQQTRKKIENKQRELSKLKAKENSVSKEQDLRKNSRKLSIF